LTLSAFAQESELYQTYHEIADELAEKVATAEGLEPGSAEWVQRMTALTLRRYHEITDAREAGEPFPEPEPVAVSERRRRLAVKAFAIAGPSL
jgi:hypothetical protein